MSRSQGFTPSGGSRGQSFPRRVQLPGPQPTSPRPLWWPPLLSYPNPPSFHLETPCGDSGPNGVTSPSRDLGVAPTESLSPWSVTQAWVRGQDWAIFRGPSLRLPQASRTNASDVKLLESMKIPHRLLSTGMKEVLMSLSPTAST